MRYRMGLVVIILALVGCNVELGKKSKDEKITYDFNDNGCKTGRREFSSKGDYCAGLKNDPLNNFCAYSLRKATYEKNCGADWALYYGNN